MYDVLALSLFYIILTMMSMMFEFMGQVQWIWGNPGLLLLAELYLIFSHIMLTWTNANLMSRSSTIPTQTNFLFLPEPSIVHLVLLLLALLLRLLSLIFILQLLSLILNFRIFCGHLSSRYLLLPILFEYLYTILKPTMTSSSSSTHQCLLQLLPIHPVQFPFGNKSFPLTSPGLTYLPTPNHGSTGVSLMDDHGSISTPPLIDSPLTNISDRSSIPSLLLEKDTVVLSDDVAVNENIDPNDMVFVIDEIMEPGEILDLDAVMNPL
ncbi:hypothetical protein HD554DRAFT_2176038 [Boletus coccyginus]|nr:hypothetical protein HD554DRAFT_2176038 [Boletus coccyginus]